MTMATRKKQDGSRRRKRWLVISIVCVVVIGAGAYIGDRMLKKRDHPGLRTFIAQWVRNYPASFAVEPIEIAITVDDHDMEQLTAVVEDARERGVIMPEGNEYVDAEVAAGDDRFKAKLRIKGKLTDHVQGSKWSFRVVAKKDGGFLGMRRFSLQHPGTRNYLCDWFYHRLMANEGIVALRYGFVHLTFNEEDLGVYAYEEHFGPELLEHNGRLPGPLFRFDPALFWEHRLNEMNKVRFDEPFAAYQAAAVDAFNSSELEKDPRFRHQFEEAVALLDAFRRGQLRASQVFDADRIARRHAVLDLIGGHHSMDWSDVKFYYDPVMKRVEPVSYESFSAFPLRTLAGSDRWTGRNEAAQDLHDRFFNDEELFRAYVHHLERLSRKSWLDSTFTAMKPALDSASATLYREFPYKELDRNIYYKNQQVIHKLLNGPKPFHAYFDDSDQGSVSLSIVPIEGLPMEVHALLLPDGTRLAPSATTIVPCRRPGRLGEPVQVRFVTAGKVKRDGLKLETSVLGASTKRQVEVFPYALLSGLDVAMGAGERVDPRSVPFLVFDDSAHTITMKPGAWTLDRTVELPAGYTCLATAPLTLNIINGAELISHARLVWKGQEGMPIKVYSADSTSHGVHVVGADGMSKLLHVSFSDLTRYKYDQERSGDVSFHRSQVTMAECSFAGTGATLLDVSVTSAELFGVRFQGGSDQLEAHYAKVKLEGGSFLDAADDAVSLEGGMADLRDVQVQRNAGVGVKGVKGARITLGAFDIAGSAVAFEGREGSNLTATDGTVTSVGLAVDAREREMRYGPVKVELARVALVKVEKEVACGAGSSVVLDGKAVANAAPERAQ